MRGRRLLVLAVVALLAACRADGDAAAPMQTDPSASVETVAADTGGTVATAVDQVSTSTSSGTVSHSIDGRSFDVFVPSSYDDSTAVPLVLLLHGYTSTGDLQETYFGMQSLAESRGFLYVHPDGTVDARGDQFWNATDACCNFDGATVDDSAYLTALIADVQQTFNVDAKRIYLVGHSNGGFMSYRMACDHADTIAAIASLAGATFDDTTACQPSEPVSVVQIHGTSDSVIGYEGGDIVGNTFPSAASTVAAWAAYNGCGQTIDATATLDLEADLAGDETDVSAYGECPSGGNVELWTIEGGDHTPDLSSTFTASVIDHLLAHPKP